MSKEKINHATPQAAELTKAIDSLRSEFQDALFETDEVVGSLVDEYDKLMSEKDENERIFRSLSMRLDAQQARIAQLEKDLYEGDQVDDE